MASISTKRPICLDPDCVYPIRGLHAFGISATRMREGKKAGVTCRMIEVGRRKFVRGSDAILYLEKLSRLGETA
jgi:hypothetical protein